MLNNGEKIIITKTMNENILLLNRIGIADFIGSNVIFRVYFSEFNYYYYFNINNDYNINSKYETLRNYNLKHLMNTL